MSLGALTTQVNTTNPPLRGHCLFPLSMNELGWATSSKENVCFKHAMHQTVWKNVHFLYFPVSARIKLILEWPIVRESNLWDKGMKRTNWLLGLIFEGSAHKLTYSGAEVLPSLHEAQMTSAFGPNAYEILTILGYALSVITQATSRL